MEKVLFQKLWSNINGNVLPLQGSRNYFSTSMLRSCKKNMKGFNTRKRHLKDLILERHISAYVAIPLT